MARVLYPLMITLALIMAFLSTGRTPIIITLLILVLVAVTNGKRFTGYLSLVKYASLGIASLFGIFWAMGLMFGKVGSSFNDAVYNLTTYIFSGLPALDSFIHSSGFSSKEPSLGENTFRFARAVFSKIGYMEAPAPLVQEFVQVPHDTNLFTIYHIYLKDFGFVGVCLPLFILGLFHNLVYRQYMRNEDNDFIRYFLVLSYVPLVQVIFQETYLSLVSTWIQFLLVAFLLTKKRFNYG
jgi:oligosaccharide repeat unit polymerase